MSNHVKHSIVQECETVWSSNYKQTVPTCTFYCMI